MTKGEFLITLRRRLTGEVSQKEVERNLLYYEKYITDAVAGGRTEEEVMEELGSPLLIAKTIVETMSADDSGEYGSRTQPQQDSGDGTSDGHFRSYTVPTWMFPLIGILILVILFTVLRVLIPILLPVILLCFLFSLIRRR